jgi:recombination protein RecA
MAQKGRRERLEFTVAAIQKRWGPRAMHKAREAPPPPVCSTGFAALDETLGLGGLPQGRFTELIGCGTAGQFSVAASTLAQAQRLGQQVAYVDAWATVDVEALVRWGVRLDALVILRPRGFAHALTMTGDLVRTRGVGTVVFDRLHDLSLLADGEASRALDQALRDWAPRLDRSLGTFLFLTETTSPGLYPDGLPLPYFASIRLLFARLEWLRRGKKVTGFASEVTILKNKLGPAGKGVRLTFPLA